MAANSARLAVVMAVSAISVQPVIPTEKIPLKQKNRRFLDDSTHLLLTAYLRIVLNYQGYSKLIKKVAPRLLILIESLASNDTRTYSKLCVKK